MEGSEAAFDYQSEESSLLDLSCTITEKSFLASPSTERNSNFSGSTNAFVSPASTIVDSGSDSATFEDPPGANRNLLPKSCEKTKSNNCMNPESFQVNEHPSPWTPERKDEGEPTIKKSLDAFYRTCQSKKPFGCNLELESASQSISAKIAELTNREGMEYALRSLKVAQMVLNRDGNKVFPQHSSGTCFSAAVESNANLEEGEKIPGLSDDVLQFLLKQNVTK